MVSEAHNFIDACSDTLRFKSINIISLPIRSRFLYQKNHVEQFKIMRCNRGIAHSIDDELENNVY